MALTIIRESLLRCATTLKLLFCNLLTHWKPLTAGRSRNGFNFEAIVGCVEMGREVAVVVAAARCR
jgi:hypothetical protein